MPERIYHGIYRYDLIRGNQQSAQDGSLSIASYPQGAAVESHFQRAEN
jgi:hypothetical protein